MEQGGSPCDTYLILKVLQNKYPTGGRNRFYDHSIQRFDQGSTTYYVKLRTLVREYIGWNQLEQRKLKIVHNILLSSTYTLHAFSLWYLFPFSPIQQFRGSIVMVRIIDFEFSFEKSILGSPESKQVVFRKCLCLLYV